MRIMGENKPRFVDLDSVAIDSRYRAASERKRDSEELRKARKEDFDRLTDTEKAQAKLLQLRFNLEKYVTTNSSH